MNKIYPSVAVRLREYTVRFVLLYLLIITGFAQADIQLEENYHYYDINGNTAEQLRNSIDRNRHLMVGNEPFDAVTDWNIKWQYNYQQTGATCVITQVSVKVLIDYRLPRWKKIHRQSNPALSMAWQRYMDNLIAHEHEHGRIAFNAADDVAQAILDSDTPADRPPPSSCSELEIAANKSGMEIIELVRAQQKWFDRVTDHGANNGATFP
ncbi:hypothetical protein AB833_04570 [Chromatiales bacterium (ex Bugula neritina AB1)]|nr:hypothetical protein AB833_04570 [Chromatiales bacterium (ex Bugula neritina AB1)]